MNGAGQQLLGIPIRAVPHEARRGERLRSALEAFFVRHRAHLVWVHGAMFLVFLAIILVPLFLPAPAEQDGPLDHFTRFANYAMWGLWFPLVFASVLFTGRSWCGLLCPMGAASEWANKVGFKRPIPTWLRWEGTPLVSFLLITFLGQTVGVRDHPEAIAEVFGGTFLVALFIGLLYGRNKRAWCRHACPIGLLLGVFSRLGAVQFAAKNKKPGGDRHTETGICPTMIDVPRKEESRHCIECFRCVKPSSPGGLYLKFRRPGEEIEQIRDHHPNPAEVWFLFLGTGAVLGGFLWLVLPSFGTIRQAVGGWFIDHGQYWIGNPGPWWLMSVHPEQREVFNWLDFGMIVGYMGFWTLAAALVLGLTTALCAALAGYFGGSPGLGRRFTELGYQYAPVAMFSLIVGLGGELFTPLHLLGVTANAVTAIKGTLLALALLWSVFLGYRILQRQGVSRTGRGFALLPGIAGSLAIAAAWWPAIVG